MYMQPGTPRLKILSSGAVLWLPMPDKGLPEIEWVPKGPNKDLYDGSEAWRQLGWIPQLTLRWSVYVDQVTASFTEGVTQGAWGYLIGPGNGQMPSLNDLMTVLSGAPSSFSISPGPAAGGFVVNYWKESKIGVNPLGQGQGLEVTFRGGAVCSSKILGAF